MPTARNHLAATKGPDNLIYAIGGVGGSNIVETYNPNTNKWSTVAPMPTARHGLAAARQVPLAINRAAGAPVQVPPHVHHADVGQVLGKPPSADERSKLRRHLPKRRWRTP